MAVAGAMWMGETAPPEYQELMLCRLYNCLPSELDGEEYERILRHIVCWNVEHKKKGEKKEIS